MDFRFTDHGSMRALERGVSSEEIRTVLCQYDDEYDGWVPNSKVRVGRSNGKRLAVLFFPEELIAVHSVWWES